MANWNSKELQTPDAIKKIGQNAQNVINNLDILLQIVKGGANVAKLFLLLSNPAGAIIKLAADEIIKLCNDFKEIGVFYLFINPNDEGYGGQTSREFGLAIKQDENGLYQFEPSIFRTDGFNVTSVVGTAYQKTLDIADLASDYRDKNGKSQADPNFEAPMPILTNIFELGGYNSETWTGHAPVYDNAPVQDLVTGISYGIYPPEMKPSKVLQIMSEAFDDRGDVSVFKIQPGKYDDARSLDVFTADGKAITKTNFDPKRLQTEALYLQTKKVGSGRFEETLTLDERVPITDQISSGKPNFAGSSNIQGVEVVAVVALVGVENYKKFVDAFESLKGLFGDLPSLTEFGDDITAIYEKATDPPDTPMTIINDTAWGTFVANDWIVGSKSNAKALISKIVKTEAYSMKKTKSQIVKVIDENGNSVAKVLKTSVDDNEAGNVQKMELLVKMHGEETFYPEETIFEGIKLPAIPAKQGAESVPGNIIIKPKKGSALDNSKTYDQVNIDDVASYGKVLGIDTAAPDSIHPDWTSIKIKDVIPLYGDFFDEIIQFAEQIKGFAADGAEMIDRFIKLIDETIAEFEKIIKKIQAFLQLFVDGLPGAGIYWLTIKTVGGNKAIQDALTGSDDAPPESLNFCAGFIMVSVSGMGGLKATEGFKTFFTALGLEFQEVSMIPETSELDTAVLALQSDYQAAQAAAADVGTTD